MERERESTSTSPGTKYTYVRGGGVVLSLWVPRLDVSLSLAAMLLAAFQVLRIPFHHLQPSSLPLLSRLPTRSNSRLGPSRISTLLFPTLETERRHQFAAVGYLPTQAFPYARKSTRRAHKFSLLAAQGHSSALVVGPNAIVTFSVLYLIRNQMSTGGVAGLGCRRGHRCGCGRRLAIGID
ncbi:hypothetical protein LX36DRAFT_177425 [Colletotrichum falcatum]|nr:hypothetical protein LX36DRAFT_177425 [Colletotrichum falcatum]